MAVEIVAGRAIAPYVGMSLYSWTIIIAVVLTGLSIGHYVGGVAADRSAQPRAWIFGGLFAASLTTLISLSLLSWLDPVLKGYNALWHAGFLTLGAFFAPSFFAGLLSPLLTALALEASPAERRGRVLGLFFALGAGGAILGTLIAGLALISWLGSAGSLLAISGVYGALGLLFLSRRQSALAAPTLLALLALGSMGPTGPCDRESSYYCIQVDSLGPADGVRALALDHLGHGLNDRRDPEHLLAPYVQGVDELVRRRVPGEAIPDAFFVGGGAFSLPRAWLSRYPEGRLMVAELDPAVTETAHDQLWLPRSDRLEVTHQDARRALRTLPSGRRFDVIFGDAFHDISIPQHLVTDEFHSLVKARLKPGGVYVINVVDFLREPRLMLSLAKTLQRRFASVELWIDLNELGPDERRTTWIVLASDQASRGARMRSLKGPLREWTRVPTAAMLDLPAVQPLVLLTDDYSPVDRLLSRLLLNPAAAEGR